MKEKISIILRIIICLSAVGGASVYVVETTNPKGIVTGILLSEDNSSAVIDEQLVSQGDLIYGVKIVEIEEDSVEFEKNGITWTQKIRQEPNPIWQQPD